MIIQEGATHECTCVWSVLYKATLNYEHYSTIAYILSNNNKLDLKLKLLYTVAGLNSLEI